MRKGEREREERGREGEERDGDEEEREREGFVERVCALVCVSVWVY